MEEYLVCAVTLEDHSLKGCGSVKVSVKEIEDKILKSRLQFAATAKGHHFVLRAWNKTDNLPIIEVSETLRIFMSKSFAQNCFYFIFADKNNRDEKENNNHNRQQDNLELALSKDKMNSRSSESEENVSVIGSPLKLESIANLSPNKSLLELTSDDLSCDIIPIQLTGLPINDARKIVSKFCQLDTETDGNESLLNSIAILCDSKDLNRTLLLGAHSDIEENQKLTTFKVTFDNRKCSLSFLDPLNLKETCHMYSSYDLLEEQDHCRELKLQANWTDDHGQSVISNLHTAQFVLHVSVPFGHKESPLQEYFLPLKQTILLNQSFKRGQFPNQLSSNPYNAMENLQTLFMNLKNGDHQTLSNFTEKGKKIHLRPVQSKDVTDQLWNIIVQCEVYQDLVLCLKTLFSVLNKNEFPLFVRNDNDTMLAKLVRQSSQGLIYFPALTGLTPLKLVVELGLENLKNNYSFILLENELCSSKDIDSLFKGSVTEDVNLSFTSMEENDEINENLLESVKKLHHIVDILCTVDLYTENLNLRTVASHIFSQYQDVGVSESHRFLIPVEAREAIQEIERYSPSVVRREYEINEETRIESFLSELPETIALPFNINSDAGDNNISIKCGVSKECYKVKTEESSMIIQVHL